MNDFTKLVFADGEYRISQSIHRDLIEASINSRLPGLEIKRIIEQFTNSIIQHYIEQSLNK